MCAHKGRHHVHRVLFVQITDDLQRLELVLGGKTVAALGFHRRGAEAHHLIKRLGSLVAQLLFRGAAGGVGRGLDAAAGILDLQIGRAVELEPQLVLPPAAEDEMGVCIDKTGRDQLALGVNDLCTLGALAFAGADLCDHAVLNEYPCILHDLDLALCLSAFGGTAFGRCEHSDVGNKHFFHLYFFSLSCTCGRGQNALSRIVFLIITSSCS